MPDAPQAPRRTLPPGPPDPIIKSGYPSGDLALFLKSLALTLALGVIVVGVYFLLSLFL